LSRAGLETLVLDSERYSDANAERAEAERQEEGRWERSNAEKAMALQSALGRAARHLHALLGFDATGSGYVTVQDDAVHVCCRGVWRKPSREYRVHPIVWHMNAEVPPATIS